MHTERADTLFEWSRGARLDGSYEDEMRTLHRVDLLILDDLGLHRHEATETGDIDELTVERHRKAPTIITSNREPAEIVTMMTDPVLGPVGDGPTAISRLRTRRRGRVLPATKETTTRRTR
ncbi:ATP-binding protein [Nocardia sp. NPDC049220]|uniref:ATP-binding protein n=1 Tax=Nocardia sp. NPDC049220 TaxID=3155273 RepID=UPI0033C46A2F